MFIPVTQLCRDVCHYHVRENALSIKRLYLEVDEIIATVVRCACRVPRGVADARRKARVAVSRSEEWLQAAGFDSTVDYVAAIARRVLDETGLFSMPAR